MNEDVVPVAVKILDKEFQVACPDNQQDSLRSAAKLLDGKMREIRDSRRVFGSDRIAIMAALNLAHELLQVRIDSVSENETLHQRIRQLRDKVQTALLRNGQIEL